MIARLRPTRFLPLLLAVGCAHGPGAVPATKADRQTVEAVRSAVDAAAARPEDPEVREHLARLLLDQGLQEPALTHALAAVELGPERASAWALLGEVRLHDSLGRRHGLDYDREGAIEALRKAVQLAPAEAAHRLSLAQALTRHRGRLWTASPDEATEAIAHWEAVPAAVGEPGAARDAYLWALGLTGEGRHLLEVTQANVEEQAVTLAALTIALGPDHLFEIALDTAENDDELGGVMAATVDQLVPLRRYAEATRLLDLLRERVDTDALRTFAEGVARTRRLEARDGAADPLAPIRRLEAWKARGDGPWPADTWSAGVDTRRERLVAMAQAAVFRDSVDAPARVARDRFFALKPPTVEGDDARGYRVTGADTTYLVVREAKGYRIRGSAQGPSLGQAAFDRLQAGDTATGRRWLKWAIEAQERDLPGESACTAASSRSTLQRLGAEDPRLAAALLVVMQGGTDPAALAVLRDARPSDLEADRWRRWALAAPQSDPGVAVEALEPLVAACPDSLPLNALLVVRAGQAGRTGVLEDWLARTPETDDPGWRSLRFHAARRVRPLPEVRTELEAWARRARRQAEAWNLLAWYGLLDGGDPQVAVGQARKAAALDAESPGIRHTLAAALAAADRPVQAREALLGYIEAEGVASDPSIWLVVGRIAAAYGLDDYAREAYGRAMEPGTDGVDPETRSLAGRWREALAN